MKDKTFDIEDMNEVLDFLHSGFKLQCEEWRDEEYIWYEPGYGIVDENGVGVDAETLMHNRIFKWRVLK